MRSKKTLSAVIAAAMLSSVIASSGMLSAGALKAATVDGIDPLDYSSYTTYDGDDLGANYTPEATTFKVWAPTSTDVKLKLYKTGSDDEDGAGEIGEHQMKLDKETGVWSVKVSGDLKNQYYTYLVTNSLNPNGKEVVDVYAKAAGVNGNRAMVVDLDSTDPVGWENDSRCLVDSPTMAEVWEVHVKDFSYDSESGVSEQYRGKYMAFTEFETTLNNAGDAKTCMNYLKDLGINYVQINPMYDFGSVDEASNDDTQFNWGYDPKNYNVPEGSYSTNPYDGNVRINEMKQMIQALHQNGIGVIMDVVYNHTYRSQDSWFNLTVPNYYYRVKDSVWSNGSGCGNDTASEREMFKKYMVDSVTYWAEEYHLDGFRFDLMGLHDSDTMEAVREALDNIDTRILTYGEGWSLGSTVDDVNWAGNAVSLCTQKKASRINERIGFFNDDIRDSLKGKAFNDLTSPGYATGSTGNAKNILPMLTATFSTSKWKLKAPGQNVVYSCCHDNQTLWDRLVASEYGVPSAMETFDNRNELFVSSNKLSGAMVMTSQGVPFILAGEEFARTKYGDHNSYKSSPDINKLDWSRSVDYADIVSYYKGLIQLRNSYPGFTDITLESGKTVEALDVPNGVIGYRLPNIVDKSGKTWSDIVVYFNGSRKDSAEVTLPEISSAQAGEKAGDVDGDNELTAADAVLVLRHSTSIALLNDAQQKVADVDGDNQITANDAVIILRRSVGLDGGSAQPTSGAGSDTVYSVIVDKQTAGIAEIRTVSGKATLEPNSALILVPKSEYDRVDLANRNYVNEGTVVVNHIDDSTKTTLYTTTIRGSEGAAYNTQTAANLLLEYDFDRVEGNASGKITKGTTTVNYYYKPYPGGVGTVVVKYVNKDTGVAFKDTTRTMRARAGTDYTTEELGFPWFKLVETPANATGKFTGDTIEVVYEFAPTEEVVQSTIHISMGENTKFQPYLHIWNIYDPSTKSKEYGTNWPGIELKDDDNDGWYEYTFPNGNGYNWILHDNQGSQTADMSNAGDIWVVANGSAANVTVTNYDPDKGADTDSDVVKGTLVVKHVDENGNEIESSRPVERPVDTPYTTKPLESDWYVLDETQLPENAEGKYTDGTIEVVYHYTAVEAKKYTVHVKLADGANFTPHLYLWEIKGTMGWPGVEMTDADQDGWYEYTFETAKTYNWIIDDGEGGVGIHQTEDHTKQEGDIWVLISGFGESDYTVSATNPDKK